MKELLFICERASQPASTVLSLPSPLFLPAPHHPHAAFGGKQGGLWGLLQLHRVKGPLPAAPQTHPTGRAGRAASPPTARHFVKASPLSPHPLTHPQPPRGRISGREGSLRPCLALAEAGRKEWRLSSWGRSPQAPAPILGAPLRWPHSAPLPDRPSPAPTPVPPLPSHRRGRRRGTPRKGKRAAPFWGPERFNNFC